MLGSDHRMTARRSEFAGFAEEFFDFPGEFSHGRIMTAASGDIPEHWRTRRSVTEAPSAAAALKGKSLETGRLDPR